MVESQPDAPKAVHDEVADAVGLIASQPSCGSRPASRRFRGLRRVHLPRIDYHVYYRFASRLRQVETAGVERGETVRADRAPPSVTRPRLAVIF